MSGVLLFNVLPDFSLTQILIKEVLEDVFKTIRTCKIRKAHVCRAQHCQVKNVSVVNIIIIELTEKLCWSIAIKIGSTMFYLCFDLV